MKITVTPEDNALSGRRLAEWRREDVRARLLNNAIAIRNVTRNEKRPYIPKDTGRYCRSCPVAIALQRLTGWPWWEVTANAANLAAPDGIVTFDLPLWLVVHMDQFDEAYGNDGWCHMAGTVFELPGVEEAMDHTLYRLSAIASGADTVEPRPKYHYAYSPEK